ncbi:fibroblast growth factor-binding protein 2b [Pygocentrus nattereri]|uniref:fibroblast growth factor-binding protein 2b n=1 Tax=Pygocentrus nattereri TaxID=42514 RepID=UPI0008142620|nr:fibroblast growth factor-binding protein 2b [Pygocentrus nattereri]
MRAACRASILLACWVWAVHAQAQTSHSISKQDNSNQGNVTTSQSTSIKQHQPEPQQRSSILDEPIRFSTKAQDACTMVISGQGDFTKLRVSCKNKGKSYWCDYLGKPNLCRPYNNNPRHYFTQIMWEMRKISNACQGLRTYKPQMCRSAVDEAQMVFHNSWPKTFTPRPAQASQDRVQTQPKQPQPSKTGATSKPPTPPKVLPKPQQPAKPVSKPGPKPVQPRKPTKSTTPKPTAEAESRANKLAEEYCWRSLQGICAYFIGWFQN